MKQLPALVAQLETFLPQHNLINTNVSKSAVGWHIHHALLVINVIIENIKQSDPDAYRSKFSFWKTVIFAVKRIPRGKAKSPKTVQPPEASALAGIQQELDAASVSIKQLEKFTPNHFFVHPIFGKLNVPSTNTFLRIHTNHHLVIIKDIIKKGQPA